MIAMLLIGAGSAWYVFSSGTHPLTVSSAVDRFRESAGSPAATPSPTASAATSRATASPGSTGSPAPRSTTSAGPGATTAKASDSSHEYPEDGVYVYATEGGEQTDALSGQRHDYPSRTTLTVRRGGCGSIVRWQPIDERWDESDACHTARGVALRRFSMYHEFFRRGVREDFACGSDAVVMPWKQTTGDRWNFRCRSEGTTLDMAVRVVGFESVPVGGRSIRAVHIRYDGTVHGDDEGRQTQDRWISTDGKLFLRIVSSTSVSVVTPFGRANYTEAYRIDLLSTSPQR